MLGVGQPLHVGFTGDLGGNTIIVRWYHRKTNLHHVSHTFLTSIVVLLQIEVYIFLSAHHHGLFPLYYHFSLLVFLSAFIVQRKDQILQVPPTFLSVLFEQNFMFSKRKFLFQVWDNMIIETAVKTFYSKDLGLMIEAIQRNITVWSSSLIVQLFFSSFCTYISFCSNP